MVEWLHLASEIGQERFSVALVEAVRDSEYFPVIAKIRKAAAVTGQQKADAQKLEAASGGMAAWLMVEEHIKRWGTSGDPHYKGGKEYRPPRLADRIAHAVRVVGGLDLIAHASDVSLPFVRRDFISAWERYEETTAAYNAMQLETPAPATGLLNSGPPKPGQPTADNPADVNVEQEIYRMVNKRFTPLREMTPEEWGDRKEILRQQAERLTAEADARAKKEEEK